MPEADSKPSTFTRFRALLVLALVLLIGVVVIIAITWWVIGSAPRSQAVAALDGVAVSQFATLPDDDAYPAALAIAADGTVYTGSYQSGALWRISPQGEVREIAGARDLIGSVTGLDIAPDGALYILDRISPLESKGAVVWRYSQGELRLVSRFPTDAFGLPDDIAVDRDSIIYISDRDPALVLSFRAERLSLNTVWQPYGEEVSPTGLAYDAARHSLLITDSAGDTVYRVAIARVSAAAQEIDGEIVRTETLFKNGSQNGYGFDGIALAPNGDIYIALLNRNRVARLEDGALVILAKDFRGASDLVYDAARDRLIVSNWNQFSLGFGTRPQLPFALDVIELGGTRQQSDA